MATSYSKNLVDKILPKIQQYEATTGRKVSRSMMDSLFRQELDVMAERDAQTRSLDMQQQSLDLQKQSAEDQASAAKVSGVVGAVSTAGQLALGYKYLSNPSNTYTGPSASATTGGFADGNIGTGPAFTEAPAYTSPAVTTAPVGAQPTTPAVGGQTGVSTPPSSGTTGGWQTWDGQPIDTPTGSASSSATGPAGTSTSTGSTNIGAGMVAGALAGAATNYLVTQTGEGKDSSSRMADWSKGVGMTKWSDEDYASKGSATVGGLAGGAAAGGPLGAAGGAAAANIVWDLGKAVKTGQISNELLGIPYADRFMNTNVNSIFDTVICSELRRQGEITERERTVCVVFRFRHIPTDMFMAYLEWAAPIVAKMKKGGIANALLLPFCKAFVAYMVNTQLGKKPTFLQRMVWKYAWSRCEIIARSHVPVAMQGVKW